MIIHFTFIECTLVRELKKDRIQNDTGLIEETILFVVTMKLGNL